MTDEERLGADVKWEPGALPQRIVLQGQTVRVEPVSAAAAWSGPVWSNLRPRR